ncbi:hypothetical protein HRR83_003906 [Exophiala dermatitidis]|uniref:Uncharacterized protein n=2 Tax=Exophiala dermatitidis TaxID=5970 RepID=H6BPW8_EXODN|nr:uncharacterized protein HMPREF1120_01876 [Exophiala dermatitidis NIH/UT8656]KAJ4522130.1 hypothetical protein HRR74_002710 [Exophiala dermatitidis]EHY53691.1 hypothetical protein HMPREF1120_01876 [Exophiala dermatitidis NIH/UT8656]KAJ4529456.1 hypothetical protein HRR73_000479 [Exophiala dermatitidis]KAJ4543889.1 hypothetical protein HRR76_001948 [Exophiala dermatitidis]KAJ4549065.1 hypothetical protein HRR77_003943 [Exophiala dermatitidis]
MDAFVSRKRRRSSPLTQTDADIVAFTAARARIEDGEQQAEHEEESTDIKLAILSSLYPNRPPEDLLEVLLTCEGCVDDAVKTLAQSIKTNGSTPTSPAAKRSLGISMTPGLQSALPFTYADKSRAGVASRINKPLTRKGKTLHLYTPDDIARHTPCSIIHNFLPTDLANALLDELLAEVPSYESISFKIFDQVVKSPHTACFYVDSLADIHRQRSEYYYNGNDIGDIRQLLPVMRHVSDLVRDAVNDEIATRIRDAYPGGKKLQYQTSKPWQPNAAFVNCYDGGSQHVGYHSDQLSYLGPRAVIGSLSLGVAREFRVRKIVPKDDDEGTTPSTSTAPSAAAASVSNSTSPFKSSSNKSSSSSAAADVSGQIAIHLPHNSLLVMHAEMQEEWKHSIAPAPTITPHPRAGNKRINITYRWYREEFRPKYTPKCRCGVPCVLKTVQRQKANRGRYMWMCQVGNKPDGGDGCGWFEWARFTDDGVPVGWKGGDNDSDTPGGGGGGGDSSSSTGDSSGDTT